MVPTPSKRLADWFGARVQKGLARSWLALLRQLAPAARQFLTPQSDFAAWQAVNHLGQGAVDDVRAALARADGLLPLISVVMPVYRPDMAQLDAAIRSVERQINPYWQLCLCDDGNDDPLVQGRLSQLAAQSDKICLARHSTNQGIASALNSAAGIAHGDVLLFLDQDDELTPDCLAEFALAFADCPEIDLAYSDSDKLSAAGHPMAPSFKPAWSPGLLLSHMYLSHAVAVRRDLFERIGGFAQGLDGSQDFDLALRAAEQARRIHHIPRILYHWRAGAGSTALAAGEKPASIAAGQAAAAAACARRAIAAEVVRPDWAETAGIGLFHLRFPQPTAATSLVLVTDAGRAPSAHWLDVMAREGCHDFQLIIIAERPAEDERLAGAVEVRRTRNLAEDLRIALRSATGEFILCVDDRVRPVKPGWLAQLSGHALALQALVAPRLIGPNGRLVAAGLVQPDHADGPEPAFAGLPGTKHGPIYLARTTHEVQAISGACMAFGRGVRQQLLSAADTATTMTGLGQLLSRQVWAAGGTVLLSGDVDFGTDLPVLSDRSAVPDRFYNPNLGMGPMQYRPTVRSPAVRQADPVRVAVVTHNLDREGAQSTLIDLLEGLVTTGRISPVVISSRPGTLAERLTALGIPLQLLPPPGRRAKPAAVREYREALVDVFRMADAQAVLANTLESHLAVAAAADAGLAALWWQHEGGDWWRYFARWPLWRRAIAFSGFGSAYRVIQVADATRRAWLPIATRDNFAVVRHGIPTERLAADRARWTRAAARAELALAAGQWCAVLLGSVSRRKSQADAIRALARIPERLVGTMRIFIVGAVVDTDYRAEMEQLLGQLPAAHRAAVSVTGGVPDAALYLAAADAFLCCSRQESAPRAIMEAMAFGLPVITTPVDGIPELVGDGSEALFYAPGDADGLSRAMQRLMDDQSFGQQLGENARARLHEISDFNAMVARFDHLLREAAWQRRSAVAGGGNDH